MRFDGYDDDLPDEEQVIDEFMGGHPRAYSVITIRLSLTALELCCDPDSASYVSR